MPLSEEEEARLLELDREIKELKEKINKYEARVPEDEVTLDKHVNYLTPLNAQLATLLGSKERLESKATSQPQGK